MSGVRTWQLSPVLIGIVFAVPLTGQSNLDGDIVNSPGGGPAAGAHVKLDSRSVPDDPRYTRADTKGHFQFPNVPFGAYTLTAEGVGCLPSVTKVRVTPDGCAQDRAHPLRGHQRPAYRPERSAFSLYLRPGTGSAADPCRRVQFCPGVPSPRRPQPVDLP